MPEKNGHHKCPDCTRTFVSRTGLGSHRRAIHGIEGSSHTTLKEREKKAAREAQSAAAVEAAKVETAEPRLKRKYTKRSPFAQATENAIVPTNGNLSPQVDGNHRFEAAACLAAGRITELLTSIAFEHDLPPRTFTAYVLRTVAATASIR